MFNGVLANCAVRDGERAREWYSRVFDRDADAAPMTGLLEWHLTDDAGVQVWVDEDRAGRSAAVVRESDLDAAADRLTAAGIAHEGPQPGGGARILPLSDPDGNSIVFIGE